MRNWDVAAARTYHEVTKHSFASVRASAHRLDWQNRPHPFKEYVGLEVLPLPEVPHLARLLQLGAGVVRSRTLPGGDVYHFRTYSSAGALYPVELYAALSSMPGVTAGLYHFHPLEAALRPLRSLDVRAVLAEAADAPELAEAEAVFVLTGILWRSAWKYQARAYRHLFWDAGTMLANLIALAAADDLAPRLYTGFVDAEVARAVGVDGRREAPLALLAVGRAERADAAPATLAPLELEAAPLSRREFDYPEAHELHDASSLESADEVRRYRDAAVEPASPGEAGVEPGREPLGDVIRRRVSVRDFEPDAVPAEDLAQILAAASVRVAADVQAAVETYLVANAVAGVDPGAYRFRPPDSFVELRRGSFRREAGYLCLKQPLGALAAATHFLLADLEAVLAARGNRGYRAAQLEAGIRAGRIQIGAFAHRLAATASTFYDDDVTAFLAPGTAEAPLLAVAVGVPARRRARR